MRGAPYQGILSALLVWIGLTLNGCACGCLHPQPLRGLHANTEPVGDVKLLDVPFFPDRSDQCGPSVLASVLSFWDHSIDPSALKKEIYLAHLKGSLPMDLLLSAQNHGLKAHLYNGSIDDLIAEIKLGHPLIAFINRGFDSFPIDHYVVITGYDSARQGLTIHSGSKKNQFITYKSFLKSWNKTERLTLLILPPDRDKESLHAEK